MLKEHVTNGLPIVLRYCKPRLRLSVAMYTVICPQWVWFCAESLCHCAVDWPISTRIWSLECKGLAESVGLWPSATRPDFSGS